MLSLPNLALRHGKVTGSNRLMYPLNNDPIVQNRLYWNEEFDEEFLQASGNKNNKTNNMNPTNGLKGFTAGASPSQPYMNADGGTDYNQYGQTANQTLGIVSSLACQLFKKCGPGQSPTPPSNNTPPPPPPPPAPTPVDTGWGIGTHIAVWGGTAVLLVGAFFGIRALMNRGK